MNTFEKEERWLRNQEPGGMSEGKRRKRGIAEASWRDVEILGLLVPRKIIVTNLLDSHSKENILQI